MKQQQYTIFVLFGAVAVLAFIALSGVNGPRYSDESPSFNREYWNSVLDRQGPRDTYRLFKEKNSHGPFERQHVATHVIGELLFEHEGAQGIEYCDADFGFGCYHGFFGRAVASEGAAIIPELDAACVSIYGPLGTGCQHGIGHGIMEFIGAASIEKALALCEETTQLTTLLGCTSGVFMEYNTPLSGVGSLETPQPRVFDEENPYEPCMDIDPSFRDSCYFELGGWYAITFNGDGDRQRELCKGIPVDRHRTRCFMGLGALFAPAFQYDIRRVVDSCRALGNIGEASCRAGASWSFWANPAFRSQASTLCEFDSVVQREHCLAEADLTEGLRSEP